MQAGGRLRPTRYAHFEGHTDLCYSNDGRYIITCGTDGEVRVFEGLDDDDCKTHVVADCASAVAYQDGSFLVGNDSNLVQAFTVDDGSPCGVITRFSAPATHIVVSGDGKTVACAGSDMTIRVHDTVAAKDKELTGHKGPVLSVALDPRGIFLASSSCDGSVRVWVVSTGSVEVSWNILPTSNTPSVTHPLCRLAFTPKGETLAVPVGGKVLLYDRDGWRAVGELSHEAVKEAISIIAISPCGTLLAAGTLDGNLIAWLLPSKAPVMAVKHPKGLAICGLAFNPKNSQEIAFVDITGQLGTIVDVGVGTEPAPVATGVENGDLGSDMGEPVSLGPMGEEEEEEEDEFSISKIKAELGFADDEEGTFLGKPETAEPTEGAVGGEESQPVPPTVPRSVGGGVKLPEVQKPFQPGMSPEHLVDRYMVWNAAGVVRQYSGDDESTIDVEFHDTATHHALHLSNTAGYTTAALSTSVLALAAPAQDGRPSKLTVHQLQNNKEWHLDTPSDIEALAVGSDWVAAATSARNLRVFGSCGTQREVLALPGPVVCLAGCGTMLLMVCHTGVGVSGDQHMSATIMDVSGSRHPFPPYCPLPLGPRCYLAWAGFTDEGSPLAADSGGVVRVLSRRRNGAWMPVLNTRDHVRGKSDHYFVVGASEEGGTVRCVLCRGARFPPTLPRPHLSLLNMKLPLCEGDTEKGELEEKLCRTRLLLPQGESEREAAERIIQEAMIKLFALACRSDRECRAVEVCNLMPDCRTVELAIKYAGKLRRLQLAERLGEVAAMKMQEEAQKREEEEEEEYRHSVGRRRGGRGGGGWSQQEEEEDDEDFPPLPSGMEEEEEEEEERETVANPLLQAARRKSTTTTAASLLAQNNPFKKNQPASSLPLSSSSSKRNIDLIDSFRKAMRKEATPVLRPIMRKAQNKKKTKDDPQEVTKPENPKPGKENLSHTPSENTPQLPTNPFQKSQNRCGGAERTPAPPPSPPAPQKPRSALEIWLSENKEMVSDAHPDLEEKDMMVKAALMFRDLDAETKQKYKDMAAEERKRPREEEKEEKKEEEEEERKEEEEEEPAEKKLKSVGSGLSKLSAFMFKKVD